jgi:hypothetical protein
MNHRSYFMEHLKAINEAINTEKLTGQGASIKSFQRHV